MVDINILYIILSVVLTIGAVVLAFKWGKTNEKWVNAKVLLKEVAEALTATSNALADDKLSEKEKDELLWEWRDVIIAAKDLI